MLGRPSVCEVVVGAPYANREHPLTQSVVGYFVNTLAIRVRMGGMASFYESLVQVNRVVNEAVSHAVVPCVRVVEGVRVAVVLLVVDMLVGGARLAGPHAAVEQGGSAGPVQRQG